MNSEQKKTKRKAIQKDLIFLIVVLAIAIILTLVFPNKRGTVITASWKFFYEMILILPAVMILMGLFNVYVPKEIVVKYIGETAGIKAIFIGLLVGSLPTGPLYIAFPMASALIEKGAKISCIIAFLSAWACIKIPQEMIELQFLGLKFMLLRLTLTIAFVIIMGLLIEQIIKWSEKNQK